MTLFQLIMLGASAFFAFKVYEHIQMLQDPEPKREDTSSPSFDSKLLLHKADREFENGNMQEALTLYRELHSKETQDAETVFKMGYIAERLGDKEEALRYYKTALEGESRNEYIHNSIASIYRAKEEYVSAKMHLNASLDINDKNPVTYYNYGNLLVDMQHLEEAKEMYKKALEIDPKLKEAQEELEKLK